MDIKFSSFVFFHKLCFNYSLFPHDPHFAFNNNLLFLDLTYGWVDIFCFPIYNFSCWSFAIAQSFQSSSNIAIPLFFILLLSFPASIELLINSKRLRRSFGSL